MPMTPNAVAILLRALHSVVHIGPKQVRPRFIVYLASCAVLAAMWIGLFVDTLHAARMVAMAGQR